MYSLKSYQTFFMFENIKTLQPIEVSSAFSPLEEFYKFVSDPPISKLILIYSYSRTISLNIVSTKSCIIFVM